MVVKKYQEPNMEWELLEDDEEVIARSTIVGNESGDGGIIDDIPWDDYF